MYCGMHSHTSAVKHGFVNYVDDRGAYSCRQLHDKLSLILPGGKLMSDLSHNASITRPFTFAGQIGDDGQCKGVQYIDR